MTSKGQSQNRLSGCGGIRQQVLGSPASPLSLSRTRPPSVDSDFMGIDATGTSFIPACSWHRAQRRRASRAGIGEAVVEESGIEPWDRLST